MTMTESWYVDCDGCGKSFQGIGEQSEVRDEAICKGWFIDMEEGIAYCEKCKKEKGK